MLEGEYLDMANQLKEKYDDITNKLYKISLLETELKKDLMTGYGVVRLLDHLISSSHIGYDNEVMVIVETLRGLLSDCMDKYVLNIDNDMGTEV